VIEPSFIILDLERHHAGWRRWVWIRRRQLRPDVARSLHGRGRWRALSAVSYLTVPTTIVVGPKPELVDDLEHLHAPKFPALQYNKAQALFFGGNFWDARATGYLLQSPDAEQAQHPPVDMLEMGFPDTACIAFRLSKAVYRPLFESVDVRSGRWKPTVRRRASSVIRRIASVSGS
jgi:hypothetical protein